MENKDLINKFILRDNCDDGYSDLILFDEHVDSKELEEKINKKKNELIGEYTIDDIYEAINELNINYNIIDMHFIRVIEY